MRVLERLRVQSLAHPGEQRQVGAVVFKNVNEKVAYLRAAIARGAMDPRVHEQAAQIVMEGGAPSRDDAAQARTLLRWMHDNVYYLNEGTETFQSAIYTLEHRYGDCDDMTIALGALLESISIPTRIEVLGWEDPKTGAFEYRHVYLRVGLPARNPKWWPAAEATMPGTKLGFEPPKYVAASAARAHRTL